MAEHDLTQVPLGKKTTYASQYDSSLLVGVPRSLNRSELSLPDRLPFQGADLWTAYELSWLNDRNKPQVALAECVFPCDSACLVESKSFKLYLNSFNNTVFPSAQAVQQTLQEDLQAVAKAPVQVTVLPLHIEQHPHIGTLEGELLDELDVSGQFDRVHPEFLSTEPRVVEECLVSHLLKSNCLVTGQPDWGSVQIRYRGPKIDRAGLLQYLISFRNHNEFHEHCVERIFMDILRHAQCERLTVYARYTRRGGLDINPIRSTDALNLPQNVRLIRQ